MRSPRGLSKTYLNLLPRSLLPAFACAASLLCVSRTPHAHHFEEITSPAIHIGDAVLNIGGYAQLEGHGGRNDNAGTGGWFLNRFRLITKLTVHDRVGLYVEVDPSDTYAGFGKAMSTDNWLHRGYWFYNVSGATTLSLGRLSPATRWSGLPLTSRLVTVNVPLSYPFPLYAWGAQIESKLRDSWAVIADLTAASNTAAFDSAGNWDHGETSFRITRSFTDSIVQMLGVAGSFDLAGTFQRFGVEARLAPVHDLSITSAFFGALEASSLVGANGILGDRTGGYALFSYDVEPMIERIAPWLPLGVEIHAQIDGRSTIGKTSDLVVTEGASLIVNDNLRLTVDHESVIDGPRHDQWLARIQVSLPF